MTDEWWTVSVAGSSSQEDAIASRLWLLDPDGVEVRQLASSISCVASFKSRPDIGSISDLQPSLDRVAADAGLDAWKEHASSYRVGSILVEPSWQHSDDSAPIVIRIDPGRSFGSGSHVTTRLALDLLQQAGVSASAVADLGCGSGVLSIAASALGCTRVWAVDIDTAARGTTATNAAANDVTNIRVLETTAENPIADASLLDAGPFDLVMANIGGLVLDQYAELISSLVRHGGDLLLTGVLDERWPSVRARYDRFAVRSELSEDGWSAALMTRQPKSSG